MTHEPLIWLRTEYHRRASMTRLAGEWAYRNGADADFAAYELAKVAERLALEAYSTAKYGPEEKDGAA